MRQFILIIMGSYFPVLLPMNAQFQKINLFSFRQVKLKKSPFREATFGALAYKLDLGRLLPTYLRSAGLKPGQKLLQLNRYWVRRAQCRELISTEKL